MKKYFYILIILFALSSCANKEIEIRGESQQVFYPAEDRFNSVYELAEVHLDSINNYAQLYKSLKRISCRGKNPVIKFRNKDKIYKVAVHVECPEMSVVGCYFFVHHLYINNLSVIYNYDQKKPLEQLDEILKELSNETKQYDSEAVRDAIVWFYVEEEESAEVIKKLLVKIIKDFEKINSQEEGVLPYYINLNHRPYRPLPPPPPPPSGVIE